MIRLLPCKPNVSAGEGGGGVGCESGYATIGPKREPYYASGWPGGNGPMPYQCHGCGRVSWITPTDFWALPELSAERLEELGLADRLSRPYTLAEALTREQAKDLFLAGFTLQEVHEIQPQERPPEEM